MNTTSFVRRNTIRDIDIEGNKFRVDFGRDDITSIVSQLEKEVKDVQERFKDIEDFAQREEKCIAEIKVLYKKAIDSILEEDASEKIFTSNDNSVFYADVYLFLIKNYTEAVNQNSPYSPQRAVKRA